jgi:nickel-dependent lactate racemase
LAVSRGEMPIYVNRELCDADVVLTIGTLKVRSSLGYCGIHHGWYPAYADSETQARFHRPRSLLSKRELLLRRRECDEAAWLLGARMTLQVVPGAGQQVLHVLAGEADAVGRQGRVLCEEAWSFPLPRRFSLVVAAIGGGPEQQTWTSVGRTLYTALNAVEDDGAIVICSQLRDRPGPALRHMARAETWEAARRALRRHSTADALAAAQLLKALQRVRVYLLSDLDESVVDELGMAYVSRAEEVATLTTHHKSCLVLGNAQHAVVSLNGGG